MDAPRHDFLSASQAYCSTLAIGLGANLPGPAGTPRATLECVRPQLERLLINWLQGNKDLQVSWSPLYRTRPVGGPPDQPVFVNAVLVVRGYELQKLVPDEETALALLDRLQTLERLHGRTHGTDAARWGPRSLDLDILFWNTLQIQHRRLVLPHPRLHLRAFVLAPLAAALVGPNEVPDQLDASLLWPEGVISLHAGSRPDADFNVSPSTTS